MKHFTMYNQEKGINAFCTRRVIMLMSSRNAKSIDSGAPCSILTIHRRTFIASDALRTFSDQRIFLRRKLFPKKSPRYLIHSVRSALF